MSKFFSKIVTRIKGEEFTLDTRIPSSYLFGFFARKIWYLAVAIYKLKRTTRAFVHTSSKIRCVKKIKYGKNLNIDKQCYIDALSTDGITFGENVSIGKNTCIECSGTLKDIGKGLIVGDNVGLGTHGFFGCAGGIKIGNNTIFGNYVTLHSENHNYSNTDIPIRNQGINRKGIVIGEDCWIGAKATILDGTNIGKGCIVAAGAVVKGDIPEYSIIGGVPAKIIKKRK